MSTTKRLVIAGIMLAVVSGGVALAATVGGSSSGPSASVHPGGPHRFAQRPGFAGGKRAGFGHAGGRRRAFFCHLAHGEAHLVIEGTVHHFRLDHGTVKSASTESIVLEEPDGTTVTIPIGEQTRIRVNREQASVSDIEAGFQAFALREGDQPARLVRAFDASSNPCQSRKQSP